MGIVIVSKLYEEAQQKAYFTVIWTGLSDLI